MVSHKVTFVVCDGNGSDVLVELPPIACKLSALVQRIIHETAPSSIVVRLPESLQHANAIWTYTKSYLDVNLWIPNINRQTTSVDTLVHVLLISDYLEDRMMTEYAAAALGDVLPTPEAWKALESLIPKELFDVCKKLNGKFHSLWVKGVEDFYPENPGTT